MLIGECMKFTEYEDISNKTKFAYAKEFDGWTLFIKECPKAFYYGDIAECILMRDSIKSFYPDEIKNG